MGIKGAIRRLDFSKKIGVFLLVSQTEPTSLSRVFPGFELCQVLQDLGAPIFRVHDLLVGVDSLLPGLGSTFDEILRREPLIFEVRVIGTRLR
jgi:hypothetical protein